MTLLVIIAFFTAITGCFILLGLSPFDFLDGLADYIQPQKTSMKSKIKESRAKKETKGLKLLLAEVREVLRLTGKSGFFSTLCILSMLLFVFGTLIAVTLNNLYLVPVLAAGFALLPFWYVKLTASRYKKQLNSELETALSVITTSYLRNKNTIIGAIEENLPYLNPPVSELFRGFLMQTKLINSNTKQALAGLKTGIDNAVFHQWVDAIVACQDDHNLKSTLVPIVAKLSDIRVVSAELDFMLYEPIKEYITMVILLLGSIPMMYFLNNSWYETLFYTDLGKILLALCGIVIFLSISAVVKHTRPIEYKR